MSWGPLRKRSHRETWKALLLKRHLCTLCGCRFPVEADGPKFFVRSFIPTFDHKVPKSLGGLDVLDNLQFAHFVRNKREADKLSGFEPVIVPYAEANIRLPIPTLDLKSVGKFFGHYRKTDIRGGMEAAFLHRQYGRCRCKATGRNQAAPDRLQSRRP